MSKFRLPLGSLSRRIHGAESELRERAASATAASKSYDADSYFAASLRGKAAGYRESADVVAALQHGRTIPKRKKVTDGNV